ncbi:MATE family efflux transporter [Dyella silvatica]|uniref:MATE family efflux transporter n=1 Tax=Dyella silvatica TaxID=2992128 RepID=UPI00225588BE|nr:MATE family efflux transporter [Dyella silvatica]
MGSDFRIAKRILSVSIPLMGSMVGNLLMMLVDRICLARYSSDTLAASGPAIYTSMAIVGFFAALVGFSRSCVAQAFGRSGHGAAAYQAAVGIFIGIVLAVILMLMAPLIEQIPFMSNRPPAITHLESQFLYWSAYFGGVMTLNMSLSSYFNGIGNTRITLVVGLIGQVVELFMTIGLVFGKFGLPELGMRGSCISTLISTIVILACYVCWMPREVWGNLQGLIFKRTGLHLHDLLSRIKKGFALGVSAGIDNLGNAAFIWIIAGLGSIALAANNVNLTVNYIGIVPLLGLGIGCSVLCGNAIGENDYPQIPKIIFVTLAIELMYVVVISFFQIATPEILLNPFGLLDKPAEIQQASIATSRVLWTYSLAFTFAMTGSAILESFGLTRFLFVTRLVLMWLLSIPTIYLITLGHVGDASFLPTCWVVGSIFEGIIGVLYFWRIWVAIKKRQNGIVMAQAPSG